MIASTNNNLPPSGFVYLLASIFALLVSPNVVMGSTTFPSVNGWEYPFQNSTTDSKVGEWAYAPGTGHPSHHGWMWMTPPRDRIHITPYGRGPHYDEKGPHVIPVPGAVLLFGTSLIGLVGFSRRKRIAT